MNLYEIAIDIPYTYHTLKDNFNLEDHTYPLSKVSCPLGSSTPLTELSDEETTEYYLKYVKEGLMSLNIKNTNN